jgi:hypothetical protein
MDMSKRAAATIAGLVFAGAAALALSAATPAGADIRTSALGQLRSDNGGGGGGGGGTNFYNPNQNYNPVHITEDGGGGLFGDGLLEPGLR